MMDLDAPKLSKVGLAYDKPWHLEKYRPKQLFRKYFFATWE